jgi:hypothetical protein
MRKLIVILVCMLSVHLHQVQGAVITVDDDGPANYNNIQDAINNSWHGDTIIVKQGTYTQNIVFSGKAVTLQSSDPDNSTVVEATIISPPAGSYSVTFDFAEGSGSVITGFTIVGRGIYCYGTSPIISKNVIRNCTNNGINGESNAAPTISDNSIESSGIHGIHACHGPIVGNTITGNNGGIVSCNGLIEGNTLWGNSNTILGFGGGLNNCQGEIINNIIARNYAANKGGGVYACNGGIRSNTILGNKTVTDGGGLFSCGGNIINNVIAGNSSYNGGGLHSCIGTIANNTIVGNRAYSGGGMRACSGIVRNNIITFNEATEVGGIYGACQNSFNNFWSNTGGNFGGGAAPAATDIVTNPLFANNGYWNSMGTPDQSDDLWIHGEYHLQSQAGRWNPDTELWVKDSAHSNCIDAGDPTSDWTAELWPHGQHINIGAYGGTPQASMSLITTGKAADINNDGWVDYNDLMLLTDWWLSDQAPIAEDIDRNRIVDFADFAMLAGNWHPKPPPPRPPIPNPLTWASPPYPTSPSSIEMIATTATSTDGSGVEYYFEDYDNPLYNSGWISFGAGQQAKWEDTGLTPQTEYRYRAKAHNKGNLLETGWSQVASATTLPEDTTPPMPNPMTWATEPYRSSTTSIRMIATTATDVSGVEYFFQCTSDANYNSAWQDSPTYEATSLPKKSYTFVVRARDKSPNQNTTDNSKAVTVDIKPPTPDPMQWAPGGEPKELYGGGGWQDYYATMTAAQASDENGPVEYYFECTTQSGFNSGWQTSRTYTVLVGRTGQGHRFRVRARDAGGNVTGWSSTLPAN